MKQYLPALIAAGLAYVFVALDYSPVLSGRPFVAAVVCGLVVFAIFKYLVK